MSVALETPFRIDGSGQVAIATDLPHQMALRVRSVIGTSPGERVMRPAYGSGAANYLYEVDDEVRATQLIAAVTDALNNWEPAIVVENVGINSLNPEDGFIELIVVYRLLTTGEVQSATVTVAATATYGWPLEQTPRTVSVPLPTFGPSIDLSGFGEGGFGEGEFGE